MGRLILRDALGSDDVLKIEVSASDFGSARDEQRFSSQRNSPNATDKSVKAVFCL